MASRRNEHRAGDHPCSKGLTRRHSTCPALPLLLRRSREVVRLRSSGVGQQSHVIEHVIERAISDMAPFLDQT